MKNDFIALFQMQLSNLITEIEAFPDEASIWILPDGISNPAGTLAYHLCGNLNEFIGNKMGGTGYVRDRPLEFSIRDVPKADLVKWITETSDMIGKVVPALDLEATFPKEVWNMEITQGGALARLLWHLGWHLGQMNYLRRLTAK